MPTFLYKCPVCGEFEYEHPINADLIACPHCAEKNPDYPSPKVKKLIAGGATFILVGGGWGREGYSK
jgi:putative FmdB family regulatory protein